jgi:putative ABC transport system substrate-binding protein
VSGRFEQFAKELVSLNVDVLVAVSAPSALAAQKATVTLPVVFLPIVDPVALKLVSNLARPEANMTGLSTMGVDLAAKRVQLVKETIPAATHIALLYDPRGPYNIVQEIAESKSAGDKLKIKVTEFKAHEVAELEPVFATIDQQGCDAIILTQAPIFFLEQKRISVLAKKQRVPMMGPAEVFAGAGILMSYGANWPIIFRRAPVYVDKILKGAKPADLPVEQPAKFDLVVNLVVAKALGIEMPALVLARADKVLE